MIVWFDPHLRQLQLEHSLQPPGSAVRRVGVLARLADAAVPVPGLDLVVRAGQVVTGRVTMGDLVAVRRHPNVLSLKRSRTYLPYDVVVETESTDGTVSTASPAPVPSGTGGPRGRGVVVGMLDWGFDFAHRELVVDDGRSRRGRFLALWDQRGGRTPTSPSPYGYGREWDAADIDRALADPDPYAALGYDPAEMDPRRRGTHGTHTLGIACGNGLAGSGVPDAASEASIIAVHLRGNDTAATDTLGDSVRIVEAVDYVLRRAGDRPVVLNMSLGQCGGPHDASPLVVRALDTLVTRSPGRVICMSAGNYYSSGQHCSCQLTEGTVTEWQWQVPDPLQQVAELEIWYHAKDALVVELWDPSGRKVCQLQPGDEHIERDGAVIVASGFHRVQDPQNRDNVVDLFLWAAAPRGTWTVRLLPRRLHNGEVHGWIERVYRGRQSRFARPDPQFTTNTICNGEHTIAVAAYDATAVPPTAGTFSSAGPTRTLRGKPDVAAPGVRIRSAGSTTVRDSIRQAGGVVTMSGTSMAAPHVTAAVARVLEVTGRDICADEVKALICGSARPSRLAADRIGCGLLDVEQALARARSRTGLTGTNGGRP